MTHLDAFAQAVGYITMLAGGFYCAAKLLAASAWVLFENIKSNGRIVDYMLWRDKRRSKVK